MLSPWPEQRRPGRYGSTPKPPSLIRLVLLLLVVLGALYQLLRLSQAGQ